MVNDLKTNLVKITRKSTTLTRKSLRSNKYTKRGHLREKLQVQQPTRRYTCFVHYWCCSVYNHKAHAYKWKRSRILGEKTKVSEEGFSAKGET